MPNSIIGVIEEEYADIDQRTSSRVPVYAQQEFEKTALKEGYRSCYEVEKNVARCLQDKTWSMWKCQKLRDDYLRCLADHNRTHRTRLLSEARWKHSLGIYSGEMDGRRKFVERIWKEYFPEKEIPYDWL